jgi:hypothetical protein
MRYHFHGHFVEEQRRGFAVHHQIQKDCETFAELRDIQDEFLVSYSIKYCYGLSIGIAEEPIIADT